MSLTPDSPVATQVVPSPNHDERTLPVDALIDRRAVAQLPELIHLDGDRLTVTEAGMLLLDAILPRVVRADESVAA